MHHFVIRAAAAVLAAVLLSSCGGGDAPSTAADAATALRTAALPAPRILAATTTTVDPGSLMDWAEGQFREYFPSHQANQTFGPYVFRFYPETGIYLGVDPQAQIIYVKGLFSDNIDPVGPVIDYACRVAPANCPVLSGVAAKGLLNGATVTVYNLNGDGSRGGLLASGSTGANGTFSVMLPWQSTGPVVLEATGGSYVSAYDGRAVTTQATMQAMLPKVSLSGETVSVNPLSDMSAALTRALLASRYSLASSLTTANNWVSWQYGLKSAPTSIIPRFDVTAVNTDAQSVHLALVLAGLDTLSKRLSPTNPDALFTALTRDFGDGLFDGKAGSTPLTLNGAALAADTGTTKFTKAFAVTFSSTAAGLRPGYVDAQFTANTIAETYQAKIIPVYEAATVASFFPPKYDSPIPDKTTSIDTSATGYSCPVGAPITFDATGKGSCGAYYTCYGATVITTTNGVSCSDGGMLIYHAAQIAVYTAQTIPVYTAATIPSYTATTVDSYLAQTTIADPAAGTIPVFRATTVHLFTEAERAAMAANDRAAGDLAAAKVSSLGIPTALQMEWLGRINDAVIASVSH